MTTTAQLLAALLTRFDALHEAYRRTPMHRTTLPVAHPKKAWANGRRIGHQDAIGTLLPEAMRAEILRALPDGNLWDATGDSPYRLDIGHQPTLDHLSAYLRGVVCEACGDAGCDKCEAEEAALLVHLFDPNTEETECGTDGLMHREPDRVTCPKCREAMG